MLSCVCRGYRWYDAQGTKPQWVFGHGLSYSKFTYSGLQVVGTLTPSADAVVYATVCNAAAGPAGSEIAQLYLGYPAAANERECVPLVTPRYIYVPIECVCLVSPECALRRAFVCC